MSNSEKQQKQTHLDKEVVRAITIKAAKAGTNFKNYVEALITADAGPIKHK